MEEVDDSEAKWFDESSEELIRELLDDTSPFIISSKVAESVPPEVRQETITNKLISTVYSGPTISDIESALPMSFRSGDDGSRSIVLPEMGLDKMESKYILKVKMSCESGLADDGYKWRKYGQKSIKSSPNPRSYYRCTNPRCNAKKQVEKSMEDPEMLIVTYKGLHLHYSYSQILLPRPHDYSATGLHVPKKPKFQTNAQKADTPESPSVMEEKQWLARRAHSMGDWKTSLANKDC